MADLLTCEGKGVLLQTFSDTPPTHYMIKLKGLSILSKNLERFNTAEFEAGGHKWKLILYPNGNKSKNVNDHISAYIMAVESNFPHLWSEIHAVFRVFLFNRNNDSYYTLQVANERRFHKMKLEWGFDQFMPLEKFNDEYNGYLVDDMCVFGAEVHVCNKNNIKGVELVMKKNVDIYKHTWKIESFSTIANNDVHDSLSFNSGGHKWKIQLYPKGSGTGTGSHISIYLALANPVSNPSDSQIYTEITIRIIDQVHDNDYFRKSKTWFNTSSSCGTGWHKFISLADFTASSNGFLMKDSCIIEAEVTVYGFTTPL